MSQINTGNISLGKTGVTTFGFENIIFVNFLSFSLVIATIILILSFYRYAKTKNLSIFKPFLVYGIVLMLVIFFKIYSINLIQLDLNYTYNFDISIRYFVIQYFYAISILLSSPITVLLNTLLLCICSKTKL